jgi:hypothetical protein
MAIERWDGARDLAREDTDFDAIRQGGEGGTMGRS